VERTDKWLPLWKVQYVVCVNGRRLYHGCLTVFACKRKAIQDILVFIYLSFLLSCIKMKYYAFSKTFVGG
jgi:hypothetical protein